MTRGSRRSPPSSSPRRRTATPRWATPNPPTPRSSAGLRQRPLPKGAPDLYNFEQGSAPNVVRAWRSGGQPTGRSSRTHQSGGPPRQGRAVPRPGLPDRRDLEDAARLLDEQGADPDEGQEAADLRHRRPRDRDADQAGEGQGPEPGRGDRGGAELPRAAP